MLTVESRVQEAVLTAIEKLLIPIVELAKKLVNVTSGRSVDGDVLKHDQRSFSDNIERLEITALSRVNSRTDLKKLMRLVVILPYGSDLLVHERNFDRQTPNHHTD